MKSQTQQRKIITEKLLRFKDNSEAVLVKNRHRIIYATLKELYPHTFTSIEKETMIDLFKDILYADRKWRALTEDFDKEQKKILSQEFQLNELGMNIGINEDIKKLNNI